MGVSVGIIGARIVVSSSSQGKWFWIKMSVKQRLEETSRLKDHWCIPPKDVDAICSLIEAAEEISVASPAEFEHESLEYDIRQVDKDAWRELLAALKAVTDD